MEPSTNSEPQQPQQQQPQPQQYGKDISQMLVMQPGEQLVCDIKRHPFGLVGIYITSGLISAAALAAAFAVPVLATSLSQSMKMAVSLGAVLVLAIVILYAYIAIKIYNGNRWIVTSDSITQVLQTGLFRKETSQLSLANLEDVTVDQDSMVQSMAGFGTLRVESASSQGKFYFDFCPNPKENARKIIEAHEAFIANRPQEAVRANYPLASTNSFNKLGQPPADGMQS